MEYVQPFSEIDFGVCSILTLRNWLRNASLFSLLAVVDEDIPSSRLLSLCSGANCFIPNFQLSRQLAAVWLYY